MRRVALLISLLLLAVASVAAAPAASANPMKELRGSCPALVRAEGSLPSYSQDVVSSALRGRFHLGHDFYPNIRPGTSWTRNPYHSANYLHRLYGLGWLDPLISAYNDPKHLYSSAQERSALSKALALSWSFVQADKSGHVQHGAAWLARIVAIRSEYLAYVARASACAGMLTRKQASGFLTSLHRHGRFLGHFNSKNSNHRLTVQMALAVLGKQFPSDGGFTKAGNAASRAFHRAFHRGYDEASGVWMENSPGYFDYALTLIDTWLGVVDPNDQGLLDARSKMQDALAWLTAPDDNVAQFGDSYLVPPEPQVGAIASTQSGMWVAQKAGYAAVKDPRTGGYLVISSSFHTWHHKHADDMSFELYDRQQRVVADTGKYDSTVPRYAKFETSAAAHSTMTVDGQDFLWFWHKHHDKPSPYGSGIEASGQADGWYAILATNPLTRRQGVTHERLFLYKPGTALVVYDIVRSSSSHRYTRYFQLGPAAQTSSISSTGLFMNGVGTAHALTDWADAPTGATQDVSGQRSPLAGWVYPQFRQAKRRDTVSWTSQAKDMDAAAVFTLGNSPLTAHGLPRTAGDLADVALSDGTQIAVSRSGTSLSVAAGPK